jgi:hypothetical protein
MAMGHECLQCGMSDRRLRRDGGPDAALANKVLSNRPVHGVRENQMNSCWLLRNSMSVDQIVPLSTIRGGRWRWCSGTESRARPRAISSDAVASPASPK